MFKGYEHSFWVRYFKNGKKESEGDFYFGTQVNDWYWYYESGQLKESSHFEQNDAHGLSKRFYRNGQQKSLDYWAFDLKEGIASSWYENGQKNYSGSFYRGLRDSVWIWYYDNGQIEDSVYFDLGDEQGIGVSYYKNGFRKAYGQWEIGYKFGVWRYFNQNGILIKKGAFNEFGNRYGEWLIKDSLGLNDSVFIYNQGSVDTAYAIDLGTNNMDSIDVKIQELEDFDKETQEESPYSEHQR